MQTLIYRNSIFHLLPHHQSPCFFFSVVQANKNFLRICPQKCPNNFKTVFFSSVTSPHPLSYGGWDDFQIKGDSADSGESNQLNILLNSIGICDKKYVFVYLFGFVCALAISRVKVSTIVAFPACAVVFAIGFSVGFVRRGGAKELKLNGNRSKLIDETFSGFIENLSILRDRLNGYNAMVSNLKNDIRQRMESKQVSLHDLEGYVQVIESTDIAFSNAIHVVESCIESILNGNQDMVGGSDQGSVRGRKKLGENLLNVSRFFGGLFGEKFDGSKSGKTKDFGKKEMLDAGVSNKKQENILADSFEDRNLNYVVNLENESPSNFSIPLDSIVKGQNRAKNYVDGAGVKNKVFESQEKILAEENGTSKSVFDQTAYNYQNNTRTVNDRRVRFKDYQDDYETLTSHNDSVDVSIRMKHIKTASTFGRQQQRETLDRNYWHSESTEDDQGESQGYSFRNETFNPEKQTTFANGEPAHGNVFGSSPSSMLDDDLEFNRYFAEASNLLNEAKGYIRHQVSDGCSENALYKSAVLLSKAIEIRPMSLLAVSQLGNTYLLHGELKLRTSHEVRSLLARTDPFSVEEGGKVFNRYGKQLADKEKIKMVLTDVCEECEELLIKAGRKFKVALSIDGSDMKALYNWGLALSFRGQLIADIGPSAAHDADKIFMAAIDKFHAIMSKSNDCASDALFKWGAALQHRSRLRRRNSREKVKLLQQARRLYEDALHMDLGNPQLQDALSSCVSELDYWHG